MHATHFSGCLSQSHTHTNTLKTYTHTLRGITHIHTHTHIKRHAAERMHTTLLFSTHLLQRTKTLFTTHLADTTIKLQSDQQQNRRWSQSHLPSVYNTGQVGNLAYSCFLPFPQPFRARAVRGNTIKTINIPKLFWCLTLTVLTAHL